MEKLLPDEGKSIWSSLPDSRDSVSIIDAHPFTRAVAFFIDVTIYKLLVILFLIVLLQQSIISPAEFSELAFVRTNIYEYPALFQNAKDLWIHITLSAFFISYFTVFESKNIWGASPGKRLLKIKVIDEEGDHLSLKKSFLRNVTKYLLRIPIVGVVFGFLELGLIFFFFRRSGDFIVNSRVASGFHKGRFFE